jgi:glycosyltransferase 2 family protein
MSANNRKPIGRVLRISGTLLSSGLFLWLILNQEWGVVWGYLLQISIVWIFLALGIYFLSQAFNNLRWCSLLWSRGVQISYWQAFRIAWSGIFASNFLPSTIGGDGLRMVAILPYTRSKSLAVGSVALDRLSNLAAMACLLPLPFSIFGAKLNVLFALALPFDLRKLIERYFPKVANAVREWASNPAAIFWAFLIAWPSNLTFMLGNFIVARELGIQISFLEIMAVQTVTYLLAILPISFNGYGVREVTLTSLLVALGASLEQASSMAILTRFMVVLVTVPGALWFSSVASDVAERT